MKLTKKIAAAALLLTLAAGAFPVLAETPYETYTYSYEGDVQISPSAYTPDKKVSTFGEAGTLNAPADIIRDGRGNFVVADKENNRIVVLDPQTLHAVKILDGFTGKNGQPDTFNKPQGVFSAPSGRLYVADTDNGRLVVFDKDYAYVTTIDPPSADILPENFKYNPKAVAVDKAGRIYVVSMNTNMGVIALDKNGGFEAFIGAQRVKPNLAELFWRTFMTEEPKAMTTSFVPVEYSNLTIDDKGFVYVTASSIDRYTLYNTIWTRSADSSYAPIKKINPSGTDVLSRTGFFPPVGDINFDAYTGAKEPVDPSSISEVTLMGNGMYTLVDKEYSKLFTYDSYGNLLYAFGGEGEALGLFSQLASVACDGDRLLALDSLDGSITLFRKTAYGRKVDEVIGYQENREYDKAMAGWRELAGLNNNFDLAYLGIGKTLLEQGDYQAAMENFRLINNRSYYSRAYKLYRQTILDKIGLLLVAGAVVLIVLLVKFFAFAKAYNGRLKPSGAPRGFREEIVYGFHVIFHPFDGFWDLKHERRGGMRGATFWLGVTLLVQLYSVLGKGYLLGEKGDVLEALVNLLAPFLLWIVANWCLTSLMDGKGSFRDIYIAASYALIPLVLFHLPCTIFSNFLITEEMSILSFVMAVGSFWMGLLIFFGMMVTHEYSFGKNIVVSLLTVVGIAIILFLVMIFFSLTGRMVDLITNIVNEITFRM